MKSSIKDFSYLSQVKTKFINDLFHNFADGAVLLTLFYCKLKIQINIFRVQILQYIQPISYDLSPTIKRQKAN